MKKSWAIVLTVMLGLILYVPILGTNVPLTTNKLQSLCQLIVNCGYAWYIGGKIAMFYKYLREHGADND